MMDFNSLKKRFIIFLILIAILIAGSGAAGCSKKSDSVNLHILAASSLSAVLSDINDLFQQSTAGIKITAIYAASGDLATQITNGAPADLFISASTKHMDDLEKKGLLKSETRINLVGNRIILAVPLNSTLNILAFEDLPDNRVQKIAMGDPEFVPAGSYGREAIELLGLEYENLLPKTILASNVMQVLSYLENESVDAGILFASDITFSEKVRAVAVAPDDVNSRIIYPAAILAVAKNDSAAKQYLDFLTGKEARAIFKKYGFLFITK